MGTVVGITARLQAQNRLSPEIQEIVKVTKSAAKEMLHLDDSTQDMVKEIRKIKQVAEQSARVFNNGMDQMQREVQELKRQLGGLDSTRVQPKVSVDDQARREISSIRQEVKALDGSKAKVHIEAVQAAGGGALLAGGVGVAGGAAAQAGGGSLLASGVIGGLAAYGGAGFFDQIIMETQANARRAVLGDTPQELQQFKKEARDLTVINPNVDRTYIKELMTQATRFDENNGTEITKLALQLNAIRPDLGGVEEYQKTMFAMQQAWKDITDVSRFGDTLAEVANTTTDIRGEALDSIVEYSTQVTKFLDTPEKLAALAKEMNNLWSLDKGFDALKESTIKLDNQGDMVNVLKTAYEAQGVDSETAQKRAETESKTIATAIHSDNVADNQFAVAALLQTFGGIQDQKVRQELLNELGAGPGEDIAKAFAPLLQAAGRIGMADSSQFNYQGRLDQSYNTYKENDPLRGFIEARTMLTNELIGLGTAIAQDISPMIKGLGTVVKETKEAFDAMPAWLAIPALATAIGAVTYGLWKLKVALSAAEAAAIQRRLGGDIPEMDIPDDPDMKGKGGRGGKRRRMNPLSWGKKEELPKRNWLTSSEAADMAFGKGAPKEVPAKVGWLDNLKSLGGLLPKGDTVVSGLKSAWEGTKLLGKAVAYKLPFIGTAIGATQILTAEDKLDAVAKVGSEALGGWGGAAAGAAIGSVIPGIGTAVGGIVGGIAGAFGGGALFDKVKSWWSDAPAIPPDNPVPLGPPIPVVPPVKAQEEKPKVVSLTIPQLTIPLHANGVLQDVPTMLRLLENPSVSQKVKDIIEKALIDALETRGGVPS